jgi:thiol-disulfide isomerase/thioredoxin
MKKSTILIVMGLLCFFFQAYAQFKYTSQPLNIGDPVPDIVIQNVVNYKTGQIHLSDFKDKLVILDFWGTYCLPCVEHFPLIQALQNKFRNQVFFLPVDIDSKFDSPSRIMAFFKAHSKVFNLPSVVQDSLLRTMFNIQYMGRYVWIKNGIVKQITDAEEVNEQNISKIIRNEEVPLRQIVKVENDYTKPLLVNGNGSKVPLTYCMRSMLFRYSPQLTGGGFDTDSIGNVTRIYDYNTTVFNLIQLANPDYNHLFKRVKLQTKHADMLQDNPKTDSALRKNVYGYEAIFPSVSRQIALRYVKEDLARYFPFTLDSAKIIDTCWVIKLSTKNSPKLTGQSKSETNIYEQLGLPVYFRNRSLEELRNALEALFKIPVLDETAYTSNVWLDLPSDTSDPVKVSKSLQNQGFTLTKELRPIEFLIVKDRDYINQLINLH